MCNFLLRFVLALVLCFHRTHPSDLMPPVSPVKENADKSAESLTSGLVSILKSASNQVPENASRSSIHSSLTAENGILRDTLEKERCVLLLVCVQVAFLLCACLLRSLSFMCRYRRKHCEKQIQKLQKRILEIQQELAVANSTERKKDLMIEQLDKVVERIADLNYHNPCCLHS